MNETRTLISRKDSHKLLFTPAPPSSRGRYVIMASHPQCLDKDLKPLSPGDRVGFVMGGFFREREQEAFGKITEIDKCGGITIEVAGIYRHFLSNGKIASISNKIYFIHHRYDSSLKARVYLVKSGQHELYVSKLD